MSSSARTVVVMAFWMTLSQSTSSADMTTVQDWSATDVAGVQAKLRCDSATGEILAFFRIDTTSADVKPQQIEFSLGPDHNAVIALPKNGVPAGGELGGAFTFSKSGCKGAKVTVAAVADGTSACGIDTAKSPQDDVASISECLRPDQYGADASGQTHCNLYAFLVLSKIFPKDVNSLAPGGAPRRAADFQTYFQKASGWSSLSPFVMPLQGRLAAAQEHANKGNVVVASTLDHIAILQPSSVALNNITPKNACVAQGGATPGDNVKLSEAWSKKGLQSVWFFYRPHP